MAFAVSPLLECVLSLHVLLGPKHHALHHEWVRRMRALDPALRRELETLGFVYRRQIPDLLTPRADDAPESFDQELARFRALPAELLLAGLGRPLYDHGGAGESVFREPGVREVMLERASAEGGEPTRVAASLCSTDRWSSPGGSRRQSSATGRTLSGRVGADRAAARPVDRRGRSPARRDRDLARARPAPAHCRVDLERQELQIDLPHEHAVAVSAENPLVLSPSVFVWPHLRVNCDPPWPLALVYAAPALVREAEPRIPPAELLRILRALADDTRLRVLKLIAERPRTTQELEPLVGLSRAGLSKSLQRLAEAGLIVPRRDGYYVVYALAPGRLDALSAALGRFLEQD